jgi:hypothetical protein
MRVKKPKSNDRATKTQKDVPAKKRASSESAAPSPPTDAQWADLYEAAESLKRLAPWRFMWDSDLVAIELPGFDQPLFCSILGAAGNCFGIAVYPGYLPYTKLLYMLEAPGDEPPLIRAGHMHAFVCYFGDRDELDKRDRDVIKNLGLRFRGGGQWPYFRVARPGQLPWFITAEDAVLLAPALQNLYMACVAIAEGRTPVDFEAGKILLRFYSPEDDAWFHTAVDRPNIKVKYDHHTVTDEILIARLKRQKKNGATVEVDMIYSPFPVRTARSSAPILPPLALVVDRDSGCVLRCEFQGNPGDWAPFLLSLVAEYMMEHGRPSTVHVRSEEIKNLLADLCRKIDVKLITGKGMPAADEAFTGIAETL